MPSDTQPPPVSPESLECKHEVSEKRVRNVVLVGAASWFCLVISIASCALAIHLLSASRPMNWMVPFGLVSAPNLQPLERFPKPDLQIDDDHARRMALYAAQAEVLTNYGMADRSNGIVRIPIDRAMDLILQRGLPERTQGASQTGGSELQLIQNISKPR